MVVDRPARQTPKVAVIRSDKSALVADTIQEIYLRQRVG